MVEVGSCVCVCVVRVVEAGGGIVEKREEGWMMVGQWWIGERERDQDQRVSLGEEVLCDAIALCEVLCLGISWS